MSMLLLVHSLLTGCAAEVAVDVDADGDGLLGAKEAELGTDPNEADSDGDGADDGKEMVEHTDPLDDAEYPYQGGWEIGSCSKDVKATGWSEGDTSNDFAMMDQFGETVHLHSFCQDVVYLVFAAFW
jgi:hypothetical protein